jgi:hypothetical protein
MPTANQQLQVTISLIHMGSYERHMAIFTHTYLQRIIRIYRN